jgi:hypothetical protein
MSFDPWRLSNTGFVVRRIHLDRDGYAKEGPYPGKYFGAGGPIYYCPEIAEVRSPMFYSDCYVRSSNHIDARAHFRRVFDEISKADKVKMQGAAQ